MHDRDGTRLGTIEVRFIDSPNEYCSALGWIDKGDLKQKNIADFAMWHLTRHTRQPNVEVRKVADHDIGNYLWKHYNMKESTDSDLLGNKNEVHQRARQRLEQMGWVLANS